MTGRYPFAPLEAAVRGSVQKVLRVEHRQIARYREVGLTPLRADELALRAGLMPYDVWPDFGVDLVAAERRRRTAATLAWRERRGETAEARDARLVYHREYYAAGGEWQRREARARYAANVESERERKRRERAVNGPALYARRREQRQARKNAVGS